MQVKKVRKRDGRIVDFDPTRISNAIERALFDAQVKDGTKAKKWTREIVSLLEERYPEALYDVENIQNVVEEVLERRNKKVAKLFAEYRRKKAELRATREKLGIPEKLTYNALIVLKERYLLRNEKGEIIETPEQLFRRIAKAIAAIDAKYGEDAEKTEETFYEMLSKLEFLPNSPTLFNAGTPLGQLSACFVLPVEDSLEGIFQAVKETALIHQSGGGTGFSFSRLRPKGDIVRSTMREASGPVSFMRVFDMATEVIKAAGRRRGANMGILRVDHPDIIEFITAKVDPKALTNFNISVAVTDSFMRAVENDEEYDLINPRTGLPVKKLRARKVWDLIIEMAWRTGDPGVIFIDEINKKNPTSHIGQIEATNPCGEQPLHSYESCNLGSINLTKIVKQSDGTMVIDWSKLKSLVENAVHFLDNVIDANRYVVPEIEKMTKGNRRIGLGVMGFADMLIMLGIPYNSPKALALAEQLMRFISEVAREKSVELGKKRGSFPNFKGSLWDKLGYAAMRNATLTTIAPTGTISIIAGVSSGIEPLFSVAFVRNVLGGRKLLEINPLFEKIAKERGFYSVELIKKIAKTGSLQKIKGIPKDVKKLFVTAFDVKPEVHVKMQAVFQKYTDNAVSKTINFPKDAKKSDVAKAYWLAYKLKCKGITIYRYGSKPTQVLTIGKEYIEAAQEFAGGKLAATACPIC